MSAPRHTARILALFWISSWLAACWDDEPCDPGWVFEDLGCKPLPTPPPAPTGGEGGDAGTEPPPEESPWGSACTTDADCSGDASFCPPSPVNTCTNINCSPGEENDGICPSGFTCVPVGSGLPTSICFPSM